MPFERRRQSALLDAQELLRLALAKLFAIETIIDFEATDSELAQTLDQSDLVNALFRTGNGHLQLPWYVLRSKF